MTPGELRGLLQKKYEPQINKPEIAVIVRSFTAQKVYVDGEVTKPGLIPLTDRMTVLQSIASAGGLKDTARANEIILIRRGPENQPVSMLVNVEKAIDGSDLSQDLALMPAEHRLRSQVSHRQCQHLGGLVHPEEHPDFTRGLLYLGDDLPAE